MLHLALIGAGAWGKNYISTLQSFRNCRIKYLCAESGNTLEKYGDEFIKVNKYEQLFSFPDIDGVIIATPNETHFEIAHAFLKKGYPILMEKPFLVNYSHAQKLRSISIRNKHKVLVGHTYLFDPAYKEVKKIVNELGSIRYISYEGANNGPYRKGTSVLWDIGPHAISLCLDIYKSEPSMISAWGVDSLRPGNEFYDFCFIKISFADQKEAFIKVSWLFPVKKRELVIIGQKHGIVYDAVAKKRISYFKNMISLDEKKKKTNDSIIYPSYDLSTPLEVEVKEFLDIIDNKSTNTYSNFDFGIKVTQLLSLAEKSIKLNGKSLNIV